ncbi:MAG: GtrA family protein [bacterium]|nr:GtrA family protein [bacterium]
MIKLFFSQFSDVKMLIKYGISGGIAALVQIGTLIFLVEQVSMDHISAVALAFIISAFVAFTFQKFWTFRDHSLSRGHFQMVSYLTLVTLAFFLTMFFMYLFVEVFHIWYVLAQIVTIGLVTIVTFLTNKNIIFNRQSVIFREKE